MSKRPADVDVKQSVKDMLLPKNEYRLVDDYVLQGGQTHPFAILVPGGGYYMVANFIEGVPIARQLNRQGISAFILYYRVKKQAKFPNPTDDLARAVAYIFANAARYGLDTSSYSIWGASAGGHLTAEFGTDNAGWRKYGLPRPGTLVLAYPVISMDRAITHIQSHDQFIGKDASAADEAMVSVERHVSADYPPTFIWCSDDDATVNPENTRRMTAALQAAGVPFESTVYHGVMHGAGPATGTPAEGWIDRAVSFWKKQAEGEQR